MEQPATSLGRRFGLILLGWLVSRLVLAWFPPVQAAGLFIHPSALAFPALVVASFAVVYGRRGDHATFWLSLGWTADVLVWLCVRPGTGWKEFGFWDAPVLIGSGIGLAAVLVATGLAALVGRREHRTPALLPLSLPLVSLTAVVVTVFTRIPYYTMADVPNEERSLMILGVEIHHINPGGLLLIVVALWATTRLRPLGLRTLMAVVFGVGMSFVLDESVYYALDQVSDEAYGGVASYVGAVGGWLLLTVGGWLWLRRQFGRPDYEPKRPSGLPSGARRVIGHRGAAGLEDENTVEAVLVAVELGLEIVEVDVGVSADGDFFLLHDGKVDRTTDGRGRLSSLTSDAVRALRTGRGHRVPTLGEVLEATREAGAVVFVDMKRTRGHHDALAAVVEAAGADHRVILDFEILDQARAMKAAHPHLCTVISPFVPALMCETAVACSVDGVDTWHQALRPGVLARLARSGMIRTCWFTSDPETGRAVLARDVDGLMSNHPDRLLD